MPGKEKARFFECARGSAEEAAASLDSLVICGVASEDTNAKGRSLLFEVVRMLSALSRSARERGGCA